MNFRCVNSPDVPRRFRQAAAGALLDGTRDLGLSSSSFDVYFVEPVADGESDLHFGDDDWKAMTLRHDHSQVRTGKLTVLLRLDSLQSEEDFQRAVFHELKHVSEKDWNVATKGARERQAARYEDEAFQRFVSEPRRQQASRKLAEKLAADARRRLEWAREQDKKQRELYGAWRGRGGW